MSRAEKKAAGLKAAPSSETAVCWTTIAESSVRLRRSRGRRLVGVGLDRGGAMSSDVGSLLIVQRLGEELGQVFPEEVAAVDDLAAAHVEEVDGEHLVFVVVAEDVGVLVVGGGDALLVLHLVDGDELVAESGGELELLGLGGLFHARGEATARARRACLREELHVADGLSVVSGVVRPSTQGPRQRLM